MARVLALSTAVPANRVPQAQAKEAVRKAVAGRPELEELLPVFDEAGVQCRYMSFPVEYYASGKTFEERNRDFVTQALDLLERAAREALERAKVKPEEIDHIFCVTTTGLATPSLEARLVYRMGFRVDVRRSPLFGIGCAGGAAALSRATEYLKAYPKHRALVLSVELCGQVFSPRALAPVDVVGAALFGDGAAAVVLGGDEIAKTGPRILFTKSILFPGTEEVMGWSFTSDGMRLILSRAIPQVVERHLKPAVEGFILQCAMSPSKISHWILHPGGPRILEQYEKSFGLSSRTLDPARECLRDFGNLSSAAVLFVLKTVMAQARQGDAGVLVAVGPGFAAEIVILRW